MTFSRALPPFYLLCVAAFSVSCRSITSPEQLNDRYREVLEQRNLTYRLKPGDTITVNFYNPPVELNQTIFILPDGRSDMFFMDNMVLAGSTVADLQRQVEVAYRDQFRNRDPEISIQIEPSGEVVFLEGEVGAAQTASYSLQMTLSQLLAGAGGYNITGSVDDVILRRSYLDSTHPEKFRINIYDDSEEIFLLPNDHIVIERTVWILCRDYLDEYLWGFVSPLTGFVFLILAAAF